LLLLGRVWLLRVGGLLVAEVWLLLRRSVWREIGLVGPHDGRLEGRGGGRDCGGGRGRRSVGIGRLSGSWSSGCGGRTIDGLTIGNVVRVGRSASLTVGMDQRRGGGWGSEERNL
jgi:hypothetical protein